MASSVGIESADLDVTVNPAVGGTITRVVHKTTGLSVLGEVPWEAIDRPIAGGAAVDETEWLTRYTGGWPLLFPNGGDACTVNGVFHGFHGEASITPWQFEASRSSMRLWRRFATAPVEMERNISIEGDVLTVSEHLRMTGSKPVEAMWGHHPAFGSDLLKGAVELTGGAGSVMADAGYDPPYNPLRPGAVGRWPHVEGRDGAVDLRSPSNPMAALAYVYDFGDAWLALRRTDNAIAAALAWDKTVFPCAWLWFECEATTDSPWNGRTSLIGLEPNTTMPANGLALAKTRGGRLLRLAPGEQKSTMLRLRVWKPEGPVNIFADTGLRSVK